MQTNSSPDCVCPTPHPTTSAQLCKYYNLVHTKDPGTLDRTRPGPVPAGRTPTGTEEPKAIASVATLSISNLLHTSSSLAQTSNPIPFLI